jgi:signal transduction histidine kinase/ligand-binding sensor domain-containing protein
MRPGRKQSPVPPLSLRQARIAAGIGPILAAGIAVALVALLAGRPALAGRPTNVAERPSASVSYGDWITASVTATVAAGQAQALPAGPQPRFERISTADGLSFPIVRDILQDRQGYVWFATDSGLNRYDGYEFTVYKHDPGDPTTSRSDYVRAIYEDRDGILWIGGGGGLDRFDRRTETFTHVDTRGQVFSIYEDGAGTLWVGFWHGLYGYDRATGEIIHSRQPDPGAPGDWARRSQSAIPAIYERQGGDLWIGTVAGLYRLDRTTNTFTHYRHDPDDPTSLGGDVVTAIYEDRQGVLWIGTAEGGLNELASPAKQGRFVRFQHDPDDPYSLSDNEVTSILEDSAGVLWIGTMNGLNRLDLSGDSLQQRRGRPAGRPYSGRQDRFTHFRHDPEDPRSLSDDVITSLYEDRSGVLWVGTANGVNKYNRRADQFIHYQKRSDLAAETLGTLDVSGLLDDSCPAVLSDSKVTAVYEDQKGLLWIGTFGGGLNRLNRESESLTVYRHNPSDPASLSSDHVSAIYEDQAGVLWVGTGNGWLEQYVPQTETFVHYRHLGAEPHAMVEDPAGDLWIGTGGEGLYRLDDAREILVQYEQHWQTPDHWRRYGSLSSHIVTSLYVDRAGVLWAGTAYGGINLWDGVDNRFTHYRHDPGDSSSLSHDRVLFIFEDPMDDKEASPELAEGAVWIGTGGGGLSRLDRATQTLTHYTEQDGLQGDTVACILADDAGFLWLGTLRGLSRFDPRTGAFRNYDERDGVGVLSGGSETAGSCFRSQSGEMFFGGVDGLYAFYPDQIGENLHPPPIAITAFKISNETVRTDLPPDEHIRLSHQENYISFEFAALDHVAPEKNQYAYMLEGLDKDWVYAGTRRHVDYPNLRPGAYVFRVKGSNNDGVWNEGGTAIRITVEPPFWETWTFRGAVAFALVWGAIGVYRQRVRNIQARSRELEAQVEERTAQLEALYRADEDLYRHLHQDQVLQALVDVAVDLLQADKSAVMIGSDETLVDETSSKGRGRWVARVARGFIPESMARLSLPRKGEGAGLVRHPEPIVVEDVADPRQQGERVELKQAFAAEGVYSFMLLPIQVAGDSFGLFVVGFVEPHAFTEDEQRVFLALAQRASLAIGNARLYEQAQELAAVEERQRLARDLHDAVSQSLFSASLIAEALPDLWQRSPDEGGQLLQKLQQASRGALAEMRALLMELRPTALAEASMTDLLSQLAQAATGREGIPVTVTVDGACELPTDVRITLYRIAQEALNNMIKHAQASQAAVSLRCEALSSLASPEEEERLCGRAELCISDDGRGFDPSSLSLERLGLGIMRERVEAIGAAFQIESEPGHGTRIRAVWTANE